MRLRACHIFIAALLVLLTAACQDGSDRIPRKEMVEIYTQMYMLDQMVRTQPDLRKQADTSLAYEGIFRAHGYTTDDFLYSVKYYLRDPNKMAKIMDDVADELSAQARSLTDEVSGYEWREHLMAVYSKPLSKKLPQNMWAQDRMNVVRDSVGNAFVGYRKPPQDVPEPERLVLRPEEEKAPADTLSPRRRDTTFLKPDKAPLKLEMERIVR